MAIIGSQIDRIKEKQQKLRELKIRGSFVVKERTQEEFNNYIKILTRDDICKYATGIHGIITLCNNSLFKCRYQGEHYKSFLKVPKRECKREKLARVESLLKP